MPYAECRKPSCHVLLEKGIGMPVYCQKHEKDGDEEKKNINRDRSAEQPRLNAGDRGYNWRWQKASKAYLNANPFCAECRRRPPPLNRIPVPATCVDHVVPHRGNQELFWDVENWQSLCTPCHNRKTARERRQKWKITG